MIMIMIVLTIIIIIIIIIIIVIVIKNGNGNRKCRTLSRYNSFLLSLTCVIGQQRNNFFAPLFVCLFVYWFPKSATFDSFNAIFFDLAVYFLHGELKCSHPATRVSFCLLKW